MKLIVATRNAHNLAEIRDLLGEVADQFEILASGDLPNLPEIVEDGTTLQDNAIKKAKETASAIEMQFQKNSFLVLADDSGLEVDALDGAPGVLSARFSQFEGLVAPQAIQEDSFQRPISYHDNNMKLLKLLEGKPEDSRTARFRCVVAIVLPNADIRLTEGTCDGSIAYSERGTQGFGYDPIFIPRGYEKTLAELGESIKNRISHRARALDNAREILRNIET